jgi:hypothetical protein
VHAGVPIRGTFALSSSATREACHTVYWNASRPITEFILQGVREDLNYILPHWNTLDHRPFSVADACRGSDLVLHPP